MILGCKIHIGVRSKITGLVHTMEDMAANVRNITVAKDLLTGKENFVYGDSRHFGAGKRENTIVRNQSGKKIMYKINK